jgi:hypothetical protein
MKTAYIIMMEKIGEMNILTLNTDILCEILGYCPYQTCLNFIQSNPLSYYDKNLAYKWRQYKCITVDETLLHEAIAFRDEQMLIIILQQPDKVSWTSNDPELEWTNCFKLIMKAGFTNICKLMTEKLLDKIWLRELARYGNFEIYIKSCQENNYTKFDIDTSLYCACKYEFVDIANYIINLINNNTTSVDRETFLRPCLISIRNDNLSIIKILTEKICKHTFSRLDLPIPVVLYIFLSKHGEYELCDKVLHAVQRELRCSFFEFVIQELIIMQEQESHPVYVIMLQKIMSLDICKKGLNSFSKIQIYGLLNRCIKNCNMEIINLIVPYFYSQGAIRTCDILNACIKYKRPDIYNDLRPLLK